MYNIEMYPVISSTIASIGYDSGKEILKIKFLSGSEYIYKDVSRDVFDGLESADSIGAYFNLNVKYNYDYEQIS